MNDRPIIKRIEVRQFEYQLPDREPRRFSSAPVYKPGSVLSRNASAIRIFSSAGITGEYVCGSGIGPGFSVIARLLLGRSAFDREALWDVCKHTVGIGLVDVALWDLAGKFLGAPIHELLGTYRTDIPCQASSLDGDGCPDGLNSPEAYVEFAQQCLELGYRAFKIHPWEDVPIRKHVTVVHALGKSVGSQMDLMLDSFNTLKTFADALKVGYACDEERFFWWEDPLRDGGVSVFAHRRLRQLVKTPLLITEHLNGLESKVDFAVGDGTDFVRADPEHDGGITGVMKIAHAAEGLGLDVEIHGCGPDRRHLMAAIRNSNYYEMQWVHPRISISTASHFFKGDYKDSLDAIDKNGCVPAPQKPGLGVEYDWDYITNHTTNILKFE